MLRRTIKRLAGHWPEFVIVLVSLFLSFANYQPGTWLTGWDNLHPEFNFTLDIKRSIFSVWQEYRGLGLLAGMAHSADLTRELFLYCLHLLGIPLSFLRYFYVFFTLAVGPLAVYYLIRTIVLSSKFDPRTKKIASFLGALFYLLNLATLQYFYTPFETFHSFYAFFPLILLFLIHYLEKPSPRHYLGLFIILILSSSSFYVQTLFVVLVLCLGFVFLDFLIQHKLSIKSLKNVLASSILIFASQAYWLTPITFFTITKGSITGQAHINLLSSAETIQRNLEFANLKDIVFLKGYWFNYLDLGANNKFDYFLPTWRNHLANPVVITIGYLSFISICIGIYYGVKKKLPYIKALIGIFLVSIFFLLGGAKVIGESLLILGEAFRSPFTKLSIVLTFTYSVFFAIGCIFLLDLFSFLHSRLTHLFTLFTVSIALIIFMTPAFTGNLIAPTMRLKIPSEYFELFEYFKTQDPATRIANFPQHTFWGWNYYSWGYRGSGFLWYGIRQPILDRTFDVWEKSSQRYYEEISTALYSENQKEFERLVDKYAINWLLIDKNIIAANSTQDLGLTKLQKFIDNSQKFTLEKNFNDKILVYQAKPDPALQDKTNVYTSGVKNFLSLSNSQFSIVNSPFDFLSLRPSPTTITNNSLNFPLSIVNSPLKLPSYSETESLVPTTISYRKTGTGLQLKFQTVLPSIFPNSVPTIVNFDLPLSQSGLVLGINNNYFEVQLPDELTTQDIFYPLTSTYLPTQKPINLDLYANSTSSKLNLINAISQVKPVQCYTHKFDREIEKIVTQNVVTLLGTDLVGCLPLALPKRETSDLNYLISLEFTYFSPTNTPANANVTNSAFGGENSPQPLIAKKEPTFARIFARPTIQSTQANLILEANETKSTQEINYRDVRIGYLPLLGQSNFYLNPVESQISIINSPLSISIPILDTPYTNITSPANNNLSSEPQNCDNFNSGQFDRQTTKDGFLYTATNANSCDQINLKHLPHDTNYAIIIDSKNLEGLPPTICFENYSTRRCDVFERLIDGQQTIIQPITNPNEPPGYTLHVFNQSFGDRPVKNLIKSITIIPLPLNFLKNISLSSSDNFPLSIVNSQLESTHPAEFLYTATIKNDQNQTLNLYQTQSPYWKALEVSKEDLDLPLWPLIAKLPYLYFANNNSQLSIVNSQLNWFNSWSIPPGDHHLVIFYLPQYLEFLGFLLLPLPFIGILIHALIRKRH